MNTQKIGEAVSVNFAYDSDEGRVFPRWIVWNGKLKPVTKVGLHHTYREGRKLFHVFSVVSRGMYLRLILDTETLHWKLEEISESFDA